MLLSMIVPMFANRQHNWKAKHSFLFLEVRVQFKKMLIQKLLSLQKKNAENVNDGSSGLFGTLQDFKLPKKYSNFFLNTI
jgi:hypothetical protein